ncbi:hypothetical protein ES703_16036 [subsurface metagenome]
MALTLDIAAAVAKGQELTKTWDEATINKEIDNLTDKNIEQIVNTLFPSGIPIDVGFYESLASLQHYTGFGQSANGFITRFS